MSYPDSILDRMYFFNTRREEVDVSSTVDNGFISGHFRLGYRYLCLKVNYVISVQIEVRYFDYNVTLICYHW